MALFTESDDECMLKAGQSGVRLCKSSILFCLEPSVSWSLSACEVSWRWARMCLLLGDLSFTGGYSRYDGSVSCESCDGEVLQGRRYGCGTRRKQLGSFDHRSDPSPLC